LIGDSLFWQPATLSFLCCSLHYCVCVVLWQIKFSLSLSCTSAVCCEMCFNCSASDQSPLTIVSSSSPEPTLDSQGPSDDITSYRTWVKFLPDSEAQAKQRLSPEIPLVCPTPVRGDSFVILNFICFLLATIRYSFINDNYSW